MSRASPRPSASPIGSSCGKASFFRKIDRYTDGPGAAAPRARCTFANVVASRRPRRGRDDRVPAVPAGAIVLMTLESSSLRAYARPAMPWRKRLDRSQSPAPELPSLILRVNAWLTSPKIHLFNNVWQWEAVYEQPGEPSPEAIAMLTPWNDYEGPPAELGVEPPSSFWPKFEHRFRPAEETWINEALPAARVGGSQGERAIALLNRVLEARDELAAALPPDGRTPGTRSGGQAILVPMKRLNDAMEAFMNYGQTVGGTLPESFRRKRTAGGKRVHTRASTSRSLGVHSRTLSHHGEPALGTVPVSRLVARVSLLPSQRLELSLTGGGAMSPTIAETAEAFSRHQFDERPILSSSMKPSGTSSVGRRSAGGPASSGPARNLRATCRTLRRLSQGSR